MTDSKPRDLTMAELELLKSPAQSGGETMPLAIPPGTQTPVSQLNPAAAAASSSGAPTAEPPDPQAFGGTVA